MVRLERISVAPSAQRRKSAEALIALLRSELHQEPDAQLKGFFEYEVGRLLEAELQQPHKALESYVSARQSSPEFLPALYALLRLARQGFGAESVEKLLEQLIALSPSGRDRASHLIDLGWYRAGRNSDRKRAQQALDDALATDGADEVVLVAAELLAWHLGADELACRAIEARANALEGQAEEQALLLADLARHLEHRGNSSAARSWFEQAARVEIASRRYVEIFAGFALRARSGEARIEALDLLQRRLAQQAATAARTSELERISQTPDAGQSPHPSQSDGTVQPSIPGQSESTRQSRNPLRPSNTLWRASGANPAEAAAAHTHTVEQTALLRALALYEQAHLLAQVQQQFGRGYAMIDEARALLPEEDVFIDDTLLFADWTERAEEAVTLRARILEQSVGSQAGRASVAIALWAGKHVQGHSAKERQKLLQSALRSSPSNPWLLSALGAELLERGDAQAYYDVLIQQVEEAPMHWWEASQLASREIGDGTAALELAQKAPAPSDAASLAAVMEALELAIEHRSFAVFEHLIAQSDKRMDEAQRTFAAVESLRFIDEEATSAVRQHAIRLVFQLAPQSLPIVLAAIQRCLHHRDLAEAEAGMELAARLVAPTWRNALQCLRGIVLLHLDRQAEAERVLKSVGDDGSADAFAQALLVETRLASGNVTMAIRESERLLSFPPESDSHRIGRHQLLRLGIASLARNQQPETRTALRRHMELSRESTSAWAMFYSGTRSGELGALSEALDALIGERPLGSADDATLAYLRGRVSGARSTAATSKAQDLTRAMADPRYRVFSSLGLATLPSSRGDESKRTALSTLANLAEGAAKGEWRCELLMSAASDACSSSADAALTALRQLRQERDEQDVGALVVSLVGLLVDKQAGAERAELLDTVARQTSDAQAGLSLRLHAQRARWVQQGANAFADGLLSASSLATQGSQLAAVAVAWEEGLSVGNEELDARAQSYRLRQPHVEDRERQELNAALGRLATLQNQNAEAVQLLEAAIAENPQDLSAYEALRTAARKTEAWSLVVSACDRLAEALEGEMRANLLEEASAILRLKLNKPHEAESRLRAALEILPDRAETQQKLHDLLVERGDTRSLLDLNAKRLRSSTAPEEQSTIYYEQARLFRSEGRLNAALESLQALLATDPAHVGALALAAETFVTLERWPEAVHALTQLAEADIPKEEAVMARLGAAEFLDRRLREPRAALKQLQLVKEATEADYAMLMRMVDLAERAGEPAEHVVELLDEASELIDDVEGRSATLMRIVEVLARSTTDPVPMQRQLERVLAQDPANVEATSRLIALAKDRPLAQIDAKTYERFLLGVQEELESDPLSAVSLKKLLRWAEWTEDLSLIYRVGDLLTALKSTSPQDRQSLRHIERRAIAENLALELDVEPLFQDIDNSSALTRAALACSEAMMRADGLTLEGYGISRKGETQALEFAPLRQRLGQLSLRFALPESGLYEGQVEVEGFALVIDKKGKAAWIVDDRLRQRVEPSDWFRAGVMLGGWRCGLLPWFMRSPQDNATRLYSVFRLLGPAPGREVLDSIERIEGEMVLKELSRRERRAIQQLVPPDMEERDFHRWARRIELAALKSGVFVAGTMLPAVSLLQGEIANNAHAVGDAFKELARFWATPTSHWFGPQGALQ